MSYITPGSDNTFPPITSVASDRPYASAYGVMHPPVAFGTYLVPYEGVANLTLSGSYTISGRGVRTLLVGGNLVLADPYSTYAFSGGVARLPLPKLTCSAVIDIPNLGRFEWVFPSPYSITAEGFVGGTASATLTLGGAYSVAASSGAVADLTLQPWGYILTTSGFVGGVGSADLTIPALELTAQAHLEDIGSGNLTLPVLRAAPSGHAWLTLPSLTMHAVGHEVVTVTYEAYAINLTTGAVSHYTNYPFDNILRFGSSYYGISASGVYLIGGDLDLTVPIDAHIKTFATKLGTQNQKRVPYVYSSGRSDGGVIVGVTADEGVTYEYESDWGEIAGSTNHRTTVGKGVKGVYYSFDVKNVNGGSLELDEISVHVAPTQRAI